MPEVPEKPGPDQVRRQLQKILTSRTFESAQRQRQILQFVVEEHLAGRELKAAIIANEFFDNDDEKARRETGRLRDKLDRYYESVGAGDPIKITVPTGRYFPDFLWTSPVQSDRPVQPAAEPPGPPPRRWEPGLDPRVDKSLREQELTALREQVIRDRLVAIRGEPKVGKTSIAKLFALEYDAAGVPILDYDFRLHDSRHGAMCAVMLESFLDRMRLPVQRLLQDNIAAFLGMLTSKQVCLILDNFESAIDAQNMITDEGLSRLMDMLLSVRGRLQSIVIVTTAYSFSTLNANSFPEFPLIGVNRPVGVSYLQNTYRWTSAEAGRIYNIRQGNPYVFHTASIQLTQSMRLGLTFDEAFERLGPDFSALTYGVLYSRFSPHEKTLAELIALHPNGLPFNGLEWIAAQRGIKNPLLVLTSLQEKGAISTVDAKGAKSVTMLPQDQLYVYNRIINKEPLHRAALTWYKYRTQRAQKRHNIDPRSEEGLDIYELIFYHAVQGNDAKEAWMALVGSPLADALESSEKSQTLLYFCQQLRDCSGFEGLSQTERGWVFFFLGLVRRQLAELEEAERYLAQAERLFSDAGDVLGQGATLTELGLVSRKGGKYGRNELDYYDRTLDILSGRQDTEAKRIRSRALGRKGQALQREGAEPVEVFRCLQAAVQLAREINDKRMLAQRLGMLGVAHRELGQRNFAAAISCFREALKVSEELQSDAAIVGALRGLAMTYEKSKNLYRALDLYLLALQKTNPSDVYGMIDRLGTLAHVYKSLQNYSESEQYYREALELSRKIQNRKAEAEDLDELGNLYRTLASQHKSSETTGEGTTKAALLQQAAEYNSRALEIQESFEGDPAGLANRHQELARTLFAMGNVEEAQGHFKSAIRYARAAKRQHLEAWQFRRLGDTFKSLGRSDAMLLCYMYALKLNPREMSGQLRQPVDTMLRAMTSEARLDLDRRLGSIDAEFGLLKM